MRALVTALTWALVAAGIVLAAGLFLRYDFALSLEQEHARATRQEARAVRHAFEVRQALEKRLLEHACTRDVHMERLGVELSSGALEPSAVDRAADGLANALGMSVVVAETSFARTRVRGRSRAAPNLEPDSTLLQRAQERYVGLRAPDGKPWMVLACARDQGKSRLWLASFKRLDQSFLATLAPPSSATELRVFEEPQPSPKAALAFAPAEALALPDVTGRNPVRVLASTRGSPEVHTLLALVFAMLAAGLLSGSAGFVVEKRREVHEQTLLELERAAERVAQGDLSSAMGRTLDSRADQTFQTFDRMTRELRDMRERLAEAEREAAFRDVAQRIAHEIKNPLAPIQISIETLRKVRQKGGADFDEVFEESTRAILEEVKRLTHIVREFGEFARLPKARPGELDLGALVRDTLPLYVPEHVEVTCQMASDVPRIRADREQITQVLVNLLKNALEAAEASKPPRLMVRVERTPEGAAMVVGDNGKGVPPSERQRMFEPYVTTKTQGTGLGLAIAKRIVSDHGGTIELGQSTLGGASVRVTLKA